MRVLFTSFNRTPFLARSGRDTRHLIAAWIVLSLASAAGAGWLCTVLLPSASLVLLVLAPMLEETVFRGGLQEWLLRRLGDACATMANLLTAVLFAGAHVAVRPALLSVLTVLPALVIGLIYQRSRRIFPCIAAHVVFNGIWLLWIGLPVTA